MNQCLKRELDLWEDGLYRRNMKRMYKTGKNYRDPRNKAAEDYRHHRSTKWMYCHECRFVRKQTNRKLRREIWNEAYYKVVPHDFKTYGWITW